MKGKKYDIVLIRHAQSLFNEATQKAAAQLSLQHLGWDELIEHPEFNKLVTYNKQYMDPSLSEKGRIQCKANVQECSSIRPDLILVSPYRRALETCSLLFNHESANVIVEPILSQVFRFSCDVPDIWEENKKMFPHYNFDKVQKFGNDWYLQNLNHQFKQKIHEKLGDERLHLKPQKRQMLLHMLQKKQIHERPEMLRKRASQIKKLLNQYKQKYQKIVVVAHYYIIEYLKSKGFSEDGNLVQYHGIPNCYPFYQKMSDLEKIH